MTEVPPKLYAWRSRLTERQQKEVRFAELYAKEFDHGTDGHSRLTMIAMLAADLDSREDFDVYWLGEIVYGILRTANNKEASVPYNELAENGQVEMLSLCQKIAIAVTTYINGGC